MGIAADAAHADSFALQVFRSLDVAAGDDGLGHNVLDGADEDHVGGTADVSIDVADAAGDRHLGVAAEQRCGDNARR